MIMTQDKNGICRGQQTQLLPEETVGKREGADPELRSERHMTLKNLLGK
jgi:hypothetical protein